MSFYLKSSGTGAFVSLAMVGLALSGCVSVLPESQAPDHLVRLSTDPLPRVAGQLNKTVLVRTPEAPNALAGPEVASSDGLKVQFMSTVRWAAAPTDMLRQSVVDALQAAEGEGWAIPSESGARGEYELVWTIRDLTFDDGADEAVCKVRVTLLQRRERRHVSSDMIITRVSSSGKSDSVRSAALAQALRETAVSVAQFVVDQVALTSEDNASTEDKPVVDKPPGVDRKS